MENNFAGELQKTLGHLLLNSRWLEVFLQILCNFPKTVRCKNNEMKKTVIFVE
jgi:hypothetical protein